MDETLKNISENLKLLRKNSGLTQEQFAEKISYSNKAVSRWENCENLPSVDVLVDICKFYGVEFEWLIKKQSVAPKKQKTQLGNKVAIVALCLLVVWTCSTILFVYSKIFSHHYFWEAFVWSVPLSALVAIPYSLRWWNKDVSLVLISIFMWSLIASIYIQFLSLNIWPIFLLGIPLQAIVVLIGFLKKEKH